MKFKFILELRKDYQKKLLHFAHQFTSQHNLDLVILTDRTWTPDELPSCGLNGSFVRSNSVFEYLLSNDNGDVAAVMTSEVRSTYTAQQTFDYINNWYTY